MDTEYTIRISGTPGTKFRFDYCGENDGCLFALLRGHGIPRWHRAEGAVPAEFYVVGNGVQVRNLKRRSANGEITLEVIGPPGVVMSMSV